MWATAKLRSRARKGGPGDDEFAAIGNVRTATAFGLAQLADGIGAARGSLGAIDAAFVERGYGQSRRADFVLGAIYGSLTVSLDSLLTSASVHSVTTQEWKRAVTAECGIETKDGRPGNGQVPKSKANECVREILGRYWPGREFPDDPDSLDAFGIAFGGGTL